MDCPSEGELSGFALGLLSEKASDAIEEHLSGCVICQSGLEQVGPSSDSLLKALRQQIPAAIYANQPEFERAKQVAIALVEKPGSKSNKTKESEKTLLPKGTILGEYRIIRQLGSGGMGTVYEVEHERLRTRRALKIADTASVARFARETAALGQLRHDNLVLAHDAGEADGHSYLVMEHVPGMDLARLVKAVGPLPIADACEIIRQSCVGLQYVHERGLVHRDLKPANLMLGDDGCVKILDLGLAFTSGDTPWSAEVTSTGQILGTIDYMAPEQADGGRQIDIRADIYSLGCTFYRLLAAIPPFNRSTFDTPWKMLVAHREEIPTPLREHRPDLPAEIDPIVTKMMAKKATDRFLVPCRIAEAIEEYCVEQNLSALIHLAHKTASDESSVSESALQSTSSLASSALVDTDPRIDIQSPSKAAHEKALPVVVPRELSKSPPRNRPPWVSILLTAGGVFALVAGVIITIQHNDGTNTVVHVPKGFEATISAQGDISVLPPNQLQERLAPPIDSIRDDASRRKPPNELPAKAHGVAQNSSSRSLGTQPLILDADKDIERAVAEWVLNQKGYLKLWYYGRISRFDELPDAKFLIDSLSLWGVPGYTPADLKKLRRLSNLRFIDLGNSRVSDEALAAVSQIKTLTWLCISRGKFTHSGFSQLKKLPNLISLSMGHQELDEPTIREIPRLRRLTHLNLNQSSVSDEDLSIFESMLQLESLELESNDITDNGVKQLASLSNLFRLNLSYNQVTDQSIPILASMKKLRFLTVKGTNLSEAGILELQAALPDCEITQ